MIIYFCEKGTNYLYVQITQNESSIQAQIFFNLHDNEMNPITALTALVGPILDKCEILSMIL